MAQARNTTDLSFEQYKQTFLSSPYVKADSMAQLREISAAENQYLYPFFLRFKDQMKAYTNGIFVIDARGIYTPIEAGLYGIIHLEKLPVVKPPVYGITDLMDCAIFHTSATDPTGGERILIFQGVFNTPFGYKFVDEGFHIKPITGLSFAAPRLMVSIDEVASQKEGLREEDEEDFVS